MRSFARSAWQLTSAMVVLLSSSWFANAAGIPKPDAQAIDGKISWIYDYEQAKSESEKTGRPMFVVFRCER